MPSPTGRGPSGAEAQDVTLALLWEEYRRADPEGYGSAGSASSTGAGMTGSHEMRETTSRASGSSSIMPARRPVIDAATGAVRQTQLPSRRSVGRVYLCSLPGRRPPDERSGRTAVVGLRPRPESLPRQPHRRLVDAWHAMNRRATFADAILDRLVLSPSPRPRRPLDAQAQGRRRVPRGPGHDRRAQPDARPRASTGPSRARRRVSPEIGTPRRARDPPIDDGDGLRRA